MAESRVPPPVQPAEPVPRKRCAPASIIDDLIVADEDDRDAIFRAGLGQGRSIFFKHLRIRADGGLGKATNAKLFFSNMRVVDAVVVLFFSAFNTITVFSNLRISYHRFTQEKLESDFVLLLDEASQASQRIFWGAHLTVVGTEAAFMFAMLLYSVYVVVKYNYCTEEGQLSHYRIWHQLYAVCCQILPRTGNFSAMKTLQFLNPQVLGTHISLALTKVEEGHSYGRVLFEFTFTHLLLGTLGFIAFVIKFAHLVERLTAHMSGHGELEGTYSAWHAFMQVALLFGFVNQFFGITEVAKVETLRLFLFMFGGEDAAMQAGELDRQEAFLASVVQHICTELYAGLSPPQRRFRRAVALLSFTHLDLQSMILDEDESQEVDANTLRQNQQADDAGAYSALLPEDVGP
jgi:hypothetical protein